ncbi:zinc finger protein 62 homolog [Homarus americanus]|uniref:Zinc finger protein 26-like 1 n=1 Tax=Homarus americanus TaxID=6706 RepID=A0A8J5K2Y9_HOMAM|nr:zinc finger protein 62 homolog [Homarus americanus]KAG7168567.1 Zinc finger protein 26-like 1 [Homarus americanus]
MDTSIVASPEPQDPPDPPSVETTSSLSPKPVLVRKRVKKPDRVIRLKKVCEQCGKAFNKSSKYLQHLRTHRPLQQCDKCNFKTKDTKRFRMHEISHKKANPEVRCNICNELFATEVTQRIHMKKIHNIHVCKYCDAEYDLERKLFDHLEQKHGHRREKKGYLDPEEAEYVKPINIFVDPPPANEKRQFICRLCNKESRNKYQLKIHIAQHLGVSSNKISDDFLLTQDVDHLIKEGGLCSSSFNPRDVTLESLVPICSLDMSVNSSIKSELDAPSEGNISDTLSSTSKTDTSLEILCNSMKRSFASTSTAFPTMKPLSDSFPTIKQEPCEDSSNEPDSDGDHDGTSYLSNFSVFRCGLCTLNFSTPHEYNVHVVRMHQKSKQTHVSKQMFEPKRVRPSFPCDSCKVVCRSVKTLRAHERKKHRKTFSCPACHVCHKTIARLLRHQKQKHKNKIRCRIQCGALFDTEEESFLHSKEVHNKEITKMACPYCHVEYSYEGNLINHLERCKDCPPERRPAHVCGNCDQILPNIKEYHEHAKNCKVQQKIKSEKNENKEIANKLLKLEGNAFSNYDEKSRNAVHVLELEGDTDSNGWSDKDDGKKSHSSDRYVGYVKTERAKTNKDKHSNYIDGPQKCKYCPDKFELKEDAVNHILAVHKNLITRMITEPQMCEVCGMIFKNQLCLCKHISKHYSDLGMWDVLVPPNLLDIVKVRSYCWVCKCTLRGKMKHHTNMRNENIDRLLAAEGMEMQETEPFNCSQCGDFFTTRNDFWKHIKIHLSNLPKWSHQLVGSSSSGNSPNKNTEVSECSECSLKFADKSELYQHLAVHFIEPYALPRTSHRKLVDTDSNSDKNGDLYEDSKLLIGSENEATDDEAESNANVFSLEDF